MEPLKVLFQVLDVNGDGGICVNDLTIGLKKLGKSLGDEVGTSMPRKNQLTAETGNI
uniref:EF-hand domain-containing protein n=1 Tax=Pundamilia nyererei TaxID=303518 RepID=A0A3B4H7M2_9CICH